MGRTSRRVRARKWVSRNPRIVRYALLACSIASLVFGAALIYYYVSFGRIIDARLQGERERSLPRVYARPLEMRRGETLSEQELVARLNDLGYAQRPTAQAPGEFAIIRNAVLITPRTGDFGGKTIRATFPAPPPVKRAGGTPAPPPPGIPALHSMNGTAKAARTDA